MLRRELEKNFSIELGDSEFSYFPGGVYNIQEIYEFIKHEFTELCNNDFKCIDCCNFGGKDPEGKHNVRYLLGKSSKVVIKATSRGKGEF